MQIPQQISFRENMLYYNYLKDNSMYIKDLNRGTLDYKGFVQEMKIKYKKRPTDKLNGVMENIDLITSVLDVLK